MVQELSLSANGMLDAAGGSMNDEDDFFMVAAECVAGLLIAVFGGFSLWGIVDHFLK